MQTRFFPTIAAMLASTIILAATGGCNQETSEPAEVTVLCGSSFAPPMERLVEEYHKQADHEVLLSFGGSEDLLPQVKLKGAGDLFITHDPYMDETEKAEAMLRWIPVGYVAPALVVQKGNPKGLTSLDDLAKPGLKIILPNPKFSTCGEMVFALLEEKGILEAVETNVDGALFRSHADIGNKMKLQFGDAAVMWKGVAHNYLDDLEIVPTEYEYDEEIRVGIIGLSYSEQPERVEAFLKFAEANAPAIFEEFGYVK